VETNLALGRTDRPHNVLPNCLGRCSLLVVMHVSSARRRTTDRRAAHGNGTAFSAVAPSKRPVFAAHRSNIREWYCPQARIAGHLTFSRLFSFSRHRGFLLALSALSRSVARWPHTAR